MRISSTIASAVIAAVALCGSPVIASEKENQGEDLFAYHGCIQCHGDSGKNPTSKVVPKIGGLPTDEIVTKAKKILSGEGGSDEAKLMHAALYSPSQCDAPPTDEELQTIASWLSAQ